MMYPSLQYSSPSDRLYPPPGSFKYNTPKPIRNGSAYKHNSDDDDEINCDKLTSCMRWCFSSPLFRLKFWRIVILIVLVVTTGHFSTVVMFRRITEPLFVVKYDSPVKISNGAANKAKEKAVEYLETSHRKINLTPPWMFEKPVEIDPRKLKKELYFMNSNQTLGLGEKTSLVSNHSEAKIKSRASTPSFVKGSRSKEEESLTSRVSKRKKESAMITGSRESQNYTVPILESDPNLKICPPIPPNLEGPVKVNLDNIPSLEVQEKSHPELLPGGRFRPSECRASHKVAIIIPFRDRAVHLAVFLHNIHPFLQKQQIDYVIYIVEQAGSKKFNRAMLMNVGSIEALKLYPYDCFIFHDIDLIPEDDRNLYTCPVQPRHMSVAINTMKYKLPYNDIFGGVSAMTVSQFQTVNGFSNKFWGWGGEDDDMSNRIKFHGLYISRYPANVARYTMMSHKKDKPNPQRYKFLNEGKKRYSNDGLNSSRYRMLDIQFRKLFTWFYVDLLKA